MEEQKKVKINQTKILYAIIAILLIYIMYRSVTVEFFTDNTENYIKYDVNFFKKDLTNI